jgi:tRNA dimethylallyltransferase
MCASSTFRTFLPDLPDPLVVMVGPTAVGKTETAIRLAERLGGEIVSADSRQFYRGMDIGTAKPTPEELARVPHHLIDVADPGSVWSLAKFQQEASAIIKEIHARGRLPFLVGGTGQYVLSVVQGWEMPAQQADHALRAALERWAAEVGPEALHRRLAVLDPQAAAFVDVPNVRRTIRALEVILRTGRTFSEQRRRTTAPYSLFFAGLTRPRELLYQRVDQRIDAMLAGGFVDEVRGLLELGYSANLPTLSAIGYREIVAYLRGRMTLDEAKNQIRRLTRRYIRQQYNWFRESDPTIHWFQAGDGAVDAMERLIRAPEAWIPQGALLEGSRRIR